MRLEQHDSYLKRFDSRVVALAEWQGKPWLTLEQSAFYPTSGGQAHDTGHLRGEGGSALVVEVRIEDGRVWHRVDRNPFASGAQVEGELDWQRRYRHMQRHSGQHLLSQALLRVDEAFETRSVSLRGPRCTIDFAAGPQAEQLAAAEALANETAYLNLPITAFEIDEAELSHYALRRPPKISGRIRLVAMGDFELAACGGTHLRSTAEAAPIKLVATERVKGDLVRVAFHVGLEALEDYTQKHQVAGELAHTFSGRVGELPARVEALQGALADLKRHHAATLKRNAEKLATALLSEAQPLGGGRLVVAALDPDDAELLPAVADALRLKLGTAALLGAVQGGRASLLFARSADLALDVAGLLRDALPSIDGRGGGRPEWAQGSGSNPEGLAGALERSAARLLRG